MLKREFTVADEYVFNQSSPVMWILSHLTRYPRLIIAYVLVCLTTNALVSFIPVQTGAAFTAVSQGDHHGLLIISLSLLCIVLLISSIDLSSRFFAGLLSKRLARDAREELYVNLLGKSQTFHNRQRVGDIMARAANDMNQLSDMIVPGVDSIVDSFTSLFITLAFIGL